MKLQINRRPLALFCSVFLVSLYISSLFYTDLKFLIGLCIAGLFAISAFAFHVLFKECVWGKKCFVVLLFILPVSLALLISYFSFDVGYREKAYNVEGSRTITAVITDTSYSSDNLQYEALIT